jgi:catechol 2,3-dioxygenase-like lactoylglutathione lyase family enzyme
MSPTDVCVLLVHPGTRITQTRAYRLTVCVLPVQRWTQMAQTLRSRAANSSCQTCAVLRLGTVVLGADDVDRAVSFWSQVLGYRVVRFPDAANGFTILVPPSGEGTRVALQLAESPPEAHPRVHLDLVVDSPAEQAAEVDRLVGLGAARVEWDSYPEDPDFIVLADPDGNRFCVVDASHG